MSAENPLARAPTNADARADSAAEATTNLSRNGIGQASPIIAVLVPCYNEERTVADVVKQFSAQLPSASIYVFDNNSSDQTAQRAKEAGAIVVCERRRGKGYVTQAMFRLVEADIYVMTDGDDTYPPGAVHRLLAPIIAGEADMVVGSRLHADSRSEFKQLNALGNRLVLWVLNSIFRVRLTDVLSGYRAFNRNFVKRLPLFGGGFEIETELTIKAIARGYRIVEIPVDLVHRPAGSHSKIRIWRDGVIILNTILTLFRDYKPLTFFGGAGLLLIALGLIPGLIVVFEFINTGFVRHWPAAALALGLVLCGLLASTVGLILHSIARRAQEFEYQLHVLVEDLAAGSARRREGAHATPVNAVEG